MLIHPASAFPALFLLLDGPHGARGQNVAVPYFRSKQVDQREDGAVYKNYARIKQDERWETKWKEGYRWLGFGGKKAYMSVGCTDMENGLTFEEAASENKKFRKGLKKLNYIQDDDYDYEYNADGEGWIGDYNCYITHYNSWSWADFEEEWETTRHLETLGYTADVWNGDNSTDPDKPYSQYWNDLTQREKRAAYAICYTKHIWDNWGEGCSSSSSD